MILSMLEEILDILEEPIEVLIYIMGVVIAWLEVECSGDWIRNWEKYNVGAKVCFVYLWLWLLWFIVYFVLDPIATSFRQSTNHSINCASIPNKGVDKEIRECLLKGRMQY